MNSTSGNSSLKAPMFGLASPTSNQNRSYHTIRAQAPMDCKPKHSPFINKFCSQEGYQVIQQLPYNFITPVSFGVKHQGVPAAFQPLTDNINGPFRYNNTNQVGKNCRRNENHEDSVVLKQRTILDFGEITMISKVHLVGHTHASRYNIYVSEFPYDSYQKVTQKATAYHKSKSERVITIGNVPGRYLMIEVTKGSPLPARKDAVIVHGLHCRDIDLDMGEGSWDMLYDKAHQIIYGFNYS